MAKKKKKKIVASVGLDGTISEYNSTSNKKNNKVVASVSLDGDIAPIKTTTTTNNKKSDRLFSAFDDGYDIGDISKTIVKGAKRLGTSVYETGKEFVKDPVQSTKTAGVSVASGTAGASNSIDRAVDDFFDWIMKRKDDDDVLNVNDFNRVMSSGTKAEKQELLRKVEEQYGRDSEEYVVYKKAFDLTDTRPEASKTIEKILNPKYYNTKTYEKYLAGELSEGQQNIWGVGENIGNMIPSMAISTVTGNPTLGSAVFYIQAQQNYTEEAKAQGYSDKDARTYGLVMGGAETLVERLGFDQLGGLSKLSSGSIVKNMAGEGLEEFIMPYIDDAVRYGNGIMNFEDGYTKEDFLESTEEAFEGAVMGAITGAIMNAGGKGLSKVDAFIEKVNTGQEITQEDIVNAGVELQEADPNAINEALEGVPNVVQQEILKNQEIEKEQKNQEQVNQDTIEEQSNNENVEMVSTEKLSRYREFDRLGQDKILSDEEIEQLRQDIKENGIKSPINILYNPDTGQAYIDEGNTRLAIAIEEGINEVPTIVTRTTDNSRFEGKKTIYLKKGLGEGKTLKPSDLSSDFTSEIKQQETPVNTMEEQTTTIEETRTTPSQEELDNLEDTRQNKSGSEYADAFYKLEKKYGKKNLYKGLNSYKTTGKALEIEQNIDGTIKDVSTGYSDGEHYHELQYSQDGKIVGILQYGEYEGEPNIKMIEVAKEYRRKGIGTKLLQELQSKYPDVEIDFGMSTPDGTKLLEKATYTVENKEIAEKLARIEEIQKKIEEYDKGYENYFENDLPIPEDYAEDYNSLDDELRKLQEETRGKKATKTFIKQDNGVKNTTKDIQTEQKEITEQVQEAIAPLQEEVQKLNKVITDLQENIAPVSQQEVEQQGEKSFKAITDEDAPTVLEDTSPDVETTNEAVEDPFYERDIKEVGNRKVKAYMYENPEVKPFFQQEARAMLGDLDNSIKGEKVWLHEWNPVEGMMEANMVTGTRRLTTSDIAELLDIYHYTYDQIRTGLNNIIEDNGKENNAVSKRIEFMLNDRLLKGYKSIDGYDIPANEEYKALIKNKNIQEYTEQAYEEWNNKINQDELVPIATEDVSNTNVEAQNVALENDLPFDDEVTSQVEKQLKNEPKNEPRIEREVKQEDPMAMFERSIDRQIGNEMTYTRSEPRVAKTKKQRLQDAWGKFQDQFVNRNYYIDKMARDTGNKQIKYAGDMLNNIAGEIDGDIFIAQTDNNGNAIAESLSSLFENAKENGYYEAFNDYLMHHSNVDRHQFGKGSVVPQEYSRQMIAEYDKMYPTMRAEATKVWKYGKNLLANMQSNGLISGQFNMTLQKMYPHYVPFMQSEQLTPFMSEDGVVRPKKAIKTAYGGAFEILQIEEAFAKYTYATKKAIRQNELFKEIVHTSNDNISIGADDRLDPTNIEQGLGVDDKGRHYVTAYENGEMIQAVISEDLYNELTKDAEHRVKALEERYELVTKPLQKASNLRRNMLTTYSPTFLAKNFLKDFQDGLLNSKYTKDFIKNYPTAFTELAIADTQLAKQFLTLYGSGNIMGEYNSNSITQSTNAKNGKFLRNMVNKVSKFNNIVELAPRYAEFKASIENGASVQEAMYNAREVTTNFGRGGYITKAINRNGFTFLNSSVQGFDKLVRNFSGENGARGVANSLSKVAIYAIAPSVINALAFGAGTDDEDEDYKALPDYIKDNYYLFKTGDGEFIRIPKGRMISVFGSAGRRTLELLQGEEDAFEGYLTNAYSQVGVQNPLESNIFAPIVQAFGSENGKTWYGTDLVPTRLQDVPAEEQYDESTDEFSKWLGEKIGVSPYKINYVLDQYSGGIGDLILPTITEEATSDGGFLAPIKDQFTANTTFDNKYVSEFYSTKDEMEVKANSSKATDEDLLKSKYLTSVSFEMSELYKEKREVQSNSDLTKEEKYRRVQSIQEQINSLAEEGLNGYENVNKTSNYAIVSDREFYKNAEGEWWTPDEEELEEINSLGMDIDDKSAYFEAKNGIYEINQKYQGTEDTYEDRKRDIIDVVRNSNLNEDYKSYLYGKYYSEDTTNIVNMLGINFDAYLDYESQYFTADKDKAGKSISGSKKKKVFNYINGMDISFEEKVILAKLEYNAYDEWNHEIIDYLNQSSITYDEMVFILKQLGFTVDNEGNIYWD